MLTYIGDLAKLVEEEVGKVVPDEIVEHPVPDESVVPEAKELEPWEELSDPGPFGYLYRNGRQVLRIQRGRPHNSCTVTCYRHPSCHLCLSLARCPDDDTLKRWVFEIDAPPDRASDAERKALTAAHKALGKSRWGGKGSAGK